MGWFKNLVRNWLNLQDSNPLSLTIIEAMNFETNVFKNRIWYRGDPAELHQLYTNSDDLVNNTSFWAAQGTTGVNFRKIHSGLPGLIVNVLADIVTNDLIGIEIDNADAETRWEKIAEDNDFGTLLNKSIVNTLVDGDGSFKISGDSSISEYPIIEFASGDDIVPERKRGRVVGICFITQAVDSSNQRYFLNEHYTKNGIEYKLFRSDGTEVELATLPQYADLVPLTNPNEFLMAVPIMLRESPKFPGRGQSVFDTKIGAFDAFDECVSSWPEALRDGRTTKYIPKTLVPQDTNGNPLKPNPFDNRYIKTGADLSEDANNKIESVAGSIPHEGLAASYSTTLDLCLQGLISPSTLGIDVKKLDNADAQREKEKATLYTRNKIIEVLQKALPKLVETVLKVDDMIHNKAPGTYKVSVSFGEYANPSFEAQVQTIGLAREKGIMSVERCVEELYGDSLTEEEKEEEIQRLKDEAGVMQLPGDNPEEELGAEDITR